ncbi:DUF4142 domain-containing protein [Silvimonas amylolytica]|uniref:DUF4142 domain-containing protein n=1 Tax=Silvimonas amylolytica TaxID=449663 RepID=A0ABQ2PQ88_9NEIS|nr:DUF4142 domain-containing protein [Silvimonas amylolytica]GGP27104.1 hypothetical protein GCM10010971_29230 [Silvimonas amylolytica]
MIDTREALFCMGLLMSTTATAAEISPDEGDGAEKPRAANAPSRRSIPDAGFVKEASRAKEEDIAAARLALQHTRTPAVQRFARHVIREQSAAGHQLEIIAPPSIDRAARTQASQEDDLASLHGLRGKAFDKAYIHMQVAANEQAVQLFQTEARSGQDPDLKTFAARTLPMLQQHLQSARQLADELA